MSSSLAYVTVESDVMLEYQQVNGESVHTLKVGSSWINLHHNYAFSREDVPFFSSDCVVLLLFNYHSILILFRNRGKLVAYVYDARLELDVWVEVQQLFEIKDFYFHKESLNLYFSTSSAVYRLNMALPGEKALPVLILATKTVWYNLLVDSTQSALFGTSFLTLEVYDLMLNQRLQSSAVLGSTALNKEIESLSFAGHEDYLVVNVENINLTIYNARSRIPLYTIEYEREAKFVVKEDLNYVAVFFDNDI